MPVNLLSALLPMLAAMTLIPLGDTAGKVLMENHGGTPLFVAWARFALGTPMALALYLAMGQRPSLRSFAKPGLWLRGLLIAGCVGTISIALQTEEIANVYGAFFLGPILSYTLGVLFLKERGTATRTALLVGGFAGVLLVVRPGFGMTSGLAWAALAGLFYGAYLTASRWLRDAARPGDLLLTQLVVATLALAPMGLPGAVALASDGLSAAEILLPAASAGASMLGNMLLIRAYGLASAGALAPFVYFQLVAATIFGITVFGTFPDTLSLAGLSMLMVSGFATLLLRR
jgi:drug/metabolite transporter (DMT)-like permease